MSEQTKNVFISHIQKGQRELGLLVVQFEHLKDQKKGLMQKLLSGDMRLSSMEAAE